MAAWRTWNGNKVLQAIDNAHAKSLKMASDEVMRHAKNEVPFDAGELAKTGVVIQNPANQLEFNISFGGGPGTGFAELPYAIRHHEIESDFQQGRKKNYLKDPFNEKFEPAYRKAVKLNAP